MPCQYRGCCVPNATEEEISLYTIKWRCVYLRRVPLLSSNSALEFMWLWYRHRYNSKLTQLDPFHRPLASCHYFLGRNAGKSLNDDVIKKFG